MSKLQNLQTAPRWTDPRHVEVKLIQDPSMTDAEFWHQRQTRSGPNVGKVGAAISMIELIGGLARIKGRTEPQEAAAAKFRMLFDRAQIGGAKATDYTKQRVDTSGPQQDASAEIGDDARRQYRDAVQYLGLVRSSLIERVVVHDQAISAIAGKGARGRDRATRELLLALDDLAVHFRLATKPAA